MIPGSDYDVDPETSLKLQDLLEWVYSDPVKYYVLHKEIMEELCISEDSLLNIIINKPSSKNKVRLCFREDHDAKQNKLIGIQLRLLYEPYHQVNYLAAKGDTILIEPEFSEKFSRILNQFEDLEALIIKVGHTRREEEYLYGDYEKNKIHFSISLPNIKVLHLICQMDFDLDLGQLTVRSLRYLELNILNFPYFIEHSNLYRRHMINLEIMVLDFLIISHVRETPILDLPKLHINSQIRFKQMISCLKNLKCLHLIGNRWEIYDLISSHSNLKMVYLQNSTKIKESDIKKLLNLPELQNLFLVENPVSGLKKNDSRIITDSINANNMFKSKLFNIMADTFALSNKNFFF